jgi:hypothetical protein
MQMHTSGDGVMMLADDPDALLTRKETAAALTKRGYITTAETLASKATRGGGPPLPALWTKAPIPLGRRARLG